MAVYHTWCCIIWLLTICMNNFLCTEIVCRSIILKLPSILLTYICYMYLISPLLGFWLELYQIYKWIRKILCIFDTYNLKVWNFEHRPLGTHCLAPTTLSPVHFCPMHIPILFYNPIILKWTPDIIEIHLQVFHYMSLKVNKTPITLLYQKKKKKRN